MDKHLIINVGRQIGSGGRAVAKLLAQAFGAQFYDREILELAARESGFAPEFFEKNDEHKGFLRSLFNLHAPNMGSSTFYTSDFSQEGLFKLQSDAIRKAAEEADCVFVGRCADYVLRDNPACFNVFITASMDFRIDHVCERHGCSRDEARRMIEKGEQERASYYNYYTGKRWGHAESYHLCVDASLLGVEATARYIAQFIEGYNK
ncbi:MAG: cytidylate kinase-like family protein [Prevotella sp.]|nr:cytidylate kinase-like family protein [Prevotella sp.]MBR1932764.1 cytidylate kinase-like family protein [Prevotella sp.]